MTERWYWDIEANDPERPWDGATLAIMMREDGEECVYSGRGCLAKVANHIEKYQATYYAHFGGGYDVPLLLNYWRPDRVQLSGSNILCASKGRTRMRDTWPFWLSSLAKVGKAVGIEKLDIDRALIERLDPDALIAYCRRDVEVLRAGMLACRDFLYAHDVDADRVHTAGMAATKLMRALEPGSYKLLCDHKIPTPLLVDMLDSGANRGGMVNSYVRGKIEGVESFDIKSSYPARYAFDDVPIGLRAATSNELAHPETFRGVALGRWRWPWRDRVPVAVDRFSGCGAGECEQWLTDDEIACLHSCNVKVELVQGWCGQDYAPIGQLFAQTLYQAKEREAIFAFFAKVFLNSWHGKCGMHPLRENYDAYFPKDYWKHAGEPKIVPDAKRGWLWRYFTLLTDDDGLCEWYQQPMISSMTLGRARAALWRINRAVEDAGGRVYYNDTDSVPCSLAPQQMPVKLGTELGDLAHEGGPYTGYFLGPKAYLFVDQNGRVAKCALKGIPHRSYADGVIDEDETGEFFREARGDERVRGSGIFARKGSGRDMRIDLFERALESQARGHKDGVTTFRAGLGDVHWRRKERIRTIKPTVQGVVCVNDRWEMLTRDELAMLDVLRSLRRMDS